MAQRNWSITKALVASFGTLILVAVGAVLWLSVGSGLTSTRQLVAEKAMLTVESISQRVRDHVGAAATQANFVAAQIEAGTIDPDDRGALFLALESSLAAAPQISASLYFSPALNATQVLRRGAHLVRRARDRSGDPRIVELMAGLRNGAGAVWGDPVYVAEIEDAVLNYRRPLFDDDRFIGAIVSSVRTEEISDFLARAATGLEATPFVLLGPREVVAYPSAGDDRLARSSEAPLPLLDEIGDPILARLWDPSVTREMWRRPDMPGFDAQMLSFDGAGYVVVYQYIQDFGPVPWIVGCYFKTRTVAAELQRLWTAVAGGIGVLLVALLAAYLIGRRMSAPLIRLTAAADAVQASGPASVGLLPPSRVHEVDVAARSFNEMVAGLREREQVRETFGKFVPKSIAAEVLADRGVLRPQTRLTTTLFTDIVGFSTVSENMTPEQLIAMLNEYFAVVIEPIERFGGVIHQFQGDAILATYNLPVEDPDHAANAVRAALEIEALTLARRFGNGVRLLTRVGINTGIAVSGTVGGAGRLGYTVHGDEVNLAARIEQLNKVLGTRVLVSESTMEAARAGAGGAGFEFVEVGDLPVRGRRGTVRVFRVLGPHTVEEALTPAAAARHGESVG